MGRGWSIVYHVVVIFAVCVAASRADAAGRVALVIGNSEYRYSKVLPNPVNDANDVAEMLERLDFTVIKLLNGDFGAIREAVRTYNSQVENADIGVVYYAGHGMELGGENWLIPVDAELKTDRDLASEAINLKVILQSVSRATELGLVILDSCRDNPFTAKMARSTLTRSVERGLARVQPAPNVLVAYAAKDGTTAIDGNGRNSPYTSALLKHMATRGLEVSFIFRKVRDDVMRATSRRQQPFAYGSLSSKAVYFREPSPTPESPPDAASIHSPAPQPAVRKIDATVWDTISNSTDEKLFQNFLKQFPDSAHIEDARRRLAGLRAGSACDLFAGDGPGTDREPKANSGETTMAQPVLATAACATAMATFPGVVRYVLQGGRAAELGMDYAKARALYEKAAASGSPQAAIRLARMYESGRGFRQSYVQAEEWYRKAAQAGEPAAMEKIADFYERGLGVRKSATQARTWRRKAQIAKERQAAAPSSPEPKRPERKAHTD